MFELICCIFFLTKIAPPPPVVIVLLPLKLKMPKSLKVPKCCVLKNDPTASAASSIKCILYFEQIFLISKILHGKPYTCTTISAFICFFVYLLNVLFFSLSKFF